MATTRTAASVFAAKLCYRVCRRAFQLHKPFFLTRDVTRNFVSAIVNKKVSASCAAFAITVEEGIINYRYVTFRKPFLCSRL